MSVAAIKKLAGVSSGNGLFTSSSVKLSGLPARCLNLAIRSGVGVAVAGCPVRTMR
ncbi:hypothetical protein KFZ76_08155 [Methylovulum psychrotolerans]|uniref:hypothetical protein n=1 Tax=Methylovulum psychrotolerans TaxID=1704499 RepID=UPI001BFF0DEE|nr:hypothetical protein [Methylovulum psychrotolerans]MBT9097678.1 hypothetical protein [Methylovulum psychrotolerans]